MHTALRVAMTLLFLTRLVIARRSGQQAPQNRGGPRSRDHRFDAMSSDGPLHRSRHQSRRNLIREIGQQAHAALGGIIFRCFEPRWNLHRDDNPRRADPLLGLFQGNCLFRLLVVRAGFGPDFRSPDCAHDERFILSEIGNDRPAQIRAILVDNRDFQTARGRAFQPLTED